MCNASFEVLADELPHDKICTFCGGQVSGDVYGFAAAGFSCYAHVCPQCGAEYVRIFRVNENPA